MNKIVKKYTEDFSECGAASSITFDNPAFVKWLELCFDKKPDEYIRGFVIEDNRITAFFGRK